MLQSVVMGYGVHGFLCTKMLYFNCESFSEFRLIVLRLTVRGQLRLRFADMFEAYYGRYEDSSTIGKTDGIRNRSLRV